MRKRLHLALMAIAMLLLSASQSALGAYPLSIKDATGAMVTIGKEPKRIVSIVPSVTEMIYAVGLGDKIVGVTAWCTFPEEARKVDKVGDVNINIEAVLSKAPDLVVADTSMSGPTVLKLRELGLTVLALKADTISEMLDALRTLGLAGGKEEKANSLAASLDKRIADVKATVGVTKARPSVFVEIWNEPLMTAGKGTYVDELVELAGGRNIAGGVSGWPVFSQETVIKEDPYLVLLTNFNKQEVMSRKAWSAMTSLKQGRVVEVNPDLFVRSGPRLIEGLEILARLLHPELY